MRTFPIMHSKMITAIPFAMIEPFRGQADVNHSQTLERLSQRGGLAPAEALAVLGSRKFEMMDADKAESLLLVAVGAWMKVHVTNQQQE